MNLATLALKNLRRRLARSVIVAASVGLAVASALSLVALANSIGTSAGESADERGADLIVMSSKSTDIFSSLMPGRMAKTLAGIAGVRSAEGELVMFVPVGADRQNLASGWDARSALWRNMPMQEGRVPRADEADAIVLGAGAARVLGRTVGDRVEIFGRMFRVSGIAAYRSAINRSMIFMPLSQLQAVSFRNGLITMIDITLAHGADEAKVEAAIARTGPFTPTPTQEMLSHDRNIEIMRAVSRSVSLIALVMGALSVLNALLMSVQERTHEIGVMMAIGWSRPRTMASIVTEGVVIGAAGCVFGVPLAYAVSLVFARLPDIEGVLVFQPTLSQILPMCAASLFICAAGSLYPAWRAAAMRPSDALRRF